MNASSTSATREALGDLIAATAWIDTHEHLVEGIEACRHGGYMRAADLSSEALFGVPLRRENLDEIDAGLRALRRPSFYRQVIEDAAGIERCQAHAYAGRAVAAKCYWAYWRPLAVAVPAEPPPREF